MSELAKSARLGRYEQREVIGEGAYGIVYRAVDLATGEPLALKELRHVGPASLARFKLEFRTVQEVHHPNLVRLDQLFEEDGTWLIAMELVPGDDLLSHVYSDSDPLGFDEPKLRAAFRQLADGLTALHAASLLHRDLKPSNVRVTAAGRVVVLDFGLTATLTDEQHNAGLGTVAYMAPEQTLGQKLGPPSDWYAFGVCLYEALTGFRPYDAPTIESLLMAKRSHPPEPPSNISPHIPPDLDDLCMRLLALEPERRPSAGEVRRALGSGRSKPSTDPATDGSLVTRTSHFEGRVRELAELSGALRRVTRGQHQLVLIEGESGIGKSALISQFVRAHADDVAASGGYVLRSRCYENEVLACKAFDGAVEVLGRILGQMDEEACRQLLPPRAALLCRLFPSLGALPLLAAQPLQGLAADPSVQRLQAFSVFRRLLSRIGESGRLVIAIEDLQWADAESFSLLRALVDGPEPVRCLILATVRPPNELDGETAEAVAGLRALDGVSTLPLHGLAASDAWRLVRELVPVDAPDHWLENIVRESAGHPLFMSVLARFAARNPNAALELTLDAAIQGELDELPERARGLVDATAAAGGPIAPPLCGRVAGLEEAELGPLLADLCNRKLLRRRSRGDVACFHDRIRHVATARFSLDRARALHAALAHVLGEQPGTDAAVLARHHEAAGQLDLAYEQYERAARQAGETLGFARAAVLYARAFEVASRLDLPAERRIALRSARGDALARSGRSTDAAHEYRLAANEATGDEHLRLSISATQHLLRSAQVKQGIALARSLLADLGVHLPSNGATAILRVGWNRLVMRSRGMFSLRRDLLKQLPAGPALIAVPHKSPANTNSLLRMRLDALHGLAMPVQWVEPYVGYWMAVRSMRLAHSQSDPYRLALAFADHAFGRSLQSNSLDEVHALVAQARELAGDDPPPEVEVELLFREGSVATSLWDLPRARERLERAQRIAIERCPDQPWLLTHVRTNLGSVLANLGEHAVLADLSAAWLAEARDRNDQFARATLEGLGFGFYRHLMLDEPERARHLIEESLAPWPEEPFSFAHFGRMFGISLIEQYRGGDRALRYLEGERGRLNRALLLKAGVAQNTVRVLHATALLAAGSGAMPQRSRQLIKQVRGLTRRLRSSTSAFADVARLTLELQLAVLDRDSEYLQRCIARASTLPTANNFMHVLGIELAQGCLAGGEARERAFAKAYAFFSEQGWKEPGRAVAMIWPVFS
ncbi:MAG TPA: protein kinase [Polyangiales bacterium]|nr:protein kinase [Polyangiales bacterium]